MEQTKKVAHVVFSRDKAFPLQKTQVILKIANEIIPIYLNYLDFTGRRYLADEETVKKAVDKVASIGTKK